MSKITYQNICSILIEMFPEYKNSDRYFDDSSSDLPYAVLCDLTLMAFENIDEKKDVVLAEKLLSLANDIFNDPTSNSELVNLFAVEVLEMVVGYRVGALLAKKLFHGQSLNYIEMTLKGYGTDAFLEEYRNK